MTACQKHLDSKLRSVNECIYFPDTFLLKKKQGEGGKKFWYFQNIVFSHFDYKISVFFVLLCQWTQNILKIFLIKIFYALDFVQNELKISFKVNMTWNMKVVLKCSFLFLMLSIYNKTDAHNPSYVPKWSCHNVAKTQYQRIKTAVLGATRIRLCSSVVMTRMKGIY